MLQFVTFLYFSVQLTLEQQWGLGCWQRSVGSPYITFRIAGSSLLVRLFLVAASGGSSSWQCRAARCGGFSCCRAEALGHVGFSGCSAWAQEPQPHPQALEHRLSSCGTRAYLPRSMWNLPRPGLEPVSPRLADRFLTSGPPRKSWKWSFTCMILDASKTYSYKLCFGGLRIDLRGN